MTPPVEIRLLEAADLELLLSAASDVFDHDIDASLAAELLGDPRHHIAAAIADGVVVGFASAVHYVHPDKPAELWINEVGVAPSHQRRGVGKRLMDCILDHGRALGCQEAWVLTEHHNEAARELYRSRGAAEQAIVYCTFRLSDRS